MTGPDDGAADRRALLLRAYAAYNAQDAEALLALVTGDVDWPDGGGGRLHGKEELRGFWTDGWRRTRTHDAPVDVAELPDGRTAVRVAQVVRSLDGAILSRGAFLHLHRVQGGLIARLDITPR
jgi:ketosteroid isomerase-like protein